MNAMALCVMLVGIQGALKTNSFLIMTLSMCLGAIIGEAIDIDKWLNKFGNFLQRKLTKGDSNSTFGEGFVTSTIFICVGAMAIVGAIEAGMKGDFATYYSKSILDLLSVMIFATTLGIGCALSAPVVFVYEAGLTLAAKYISVFMSDAMINEVSAAGSLIVFAIGLNMTGLTKIKVANLIPAAILPVLFCLLIK